MLVSVGCQTGPTRTAKAMTFPERSSQTAIRFAQIERDLASDTTQDSPNSDQATDVVQAGFVESADGTQIQQVTAQRPVLEADQELIAPGDPLSLVDVLQSVTRSFPEIEVTIGELETADGKVLSSWGEFDSVASGHSISQPLGFYQTNRNGVGLSRPLYSGGEVYGTYRIGRGNFEPWFKERETNEGGEFKAGFSLPFLKDSAIDKRRAQLMKAGAGRDEVEATVEQKLLMFQRFASQAYWDWVAAGQAVGIQKRLLGLAETRVSQIDKRIEVGDLAKIARLDNDRFIAKRELEIIKARLILRKTAIKLSLFYRDEAGQPVLPTESQLPPEVNLGRRISDVDLQQDVQNALAVRPELAALLAQRTAACVDLQYSENLMLPKLDMKGFAGQDVGGAASSTGDKTPFELQLGVYAEVPLQRRQGLGKRQSALGKLTQIDAKSQMVADKIRAEIQDAASVVNAALDQVQQAGENLRLTQEALGVGQQLFDAGDIDLLRLNIYESDVAIAELQLLDAQFKSIFYQIIYDTARSGRAFDR